MTEPIQLRRRRAASWTQRNPVLRQGEPGFELDTGKLKIGDGETAWTELAYTGGGVAEPVAYYFGDDIQITSNWEAAAQAFLVGNQVFFRGVIDKIASPTATTLSDGLPEELRPTEHTRLLWSAIYDNGGANPKIPVFVFIQGNTGLVQVEIQYEDDTALPVGSNLLLMGSYLVV